MRFRNHADLTRFHQFYQDHEFRVHIDRVYAPDEASTIEYGIGLSPEQREALLLAVGNGYFAVPHETKLEKIAEELGITRQAASKCFETGIEMNFVLKDGVGAAVALDVEAFAEAHGFVSEAREIIIEERERE